MYLKRMNCPSNSSVFLWALIQVNILLFCVSPLFCWVDISKNPVVSYRNKSVTLRAHWINSSQSLTQVFGDDHLVVYYNHEMDSAITWPLKFFSDGWQYIKNVYNPSTPSILFAILHAGKSDVCLPLLRDEFDYFNRHNINMIDCGRQTQKMSNPTLAWTESAENVITLAEQFGRIVFASIFDKTGGFMSMDYNIVQTMMGILTYDVLVNTKRFKEADHWRNTTFSSKEPARGSNDKVLQNWYYPIYTLHGKSRVLQTFLTIIPLSWIEQKNMRLAEFVHCWSGAAGVDLWYFAVTSFVWTMQDHRRYLTAKSVYPQFKYSNTFPNTTLSIPLLQLNETWDHVSKPENVVLGYIDPFLALYIEYDIDVSKVIWLAQPLSDAWRYAQRTYGPFGEDPLLYIILHENNLQSWCYTSTENTARNNIFQNRTAIDCAVEFGGWPDQFYKSVLMMQLCEIISQSARGSGNWQTEDLARRTYGPPTDIIQWDIYMNTNMTADADAFFKSRIEDQSYLKDQLFSNWWYPTYNKFGQTKLLSKLFLLLHLHWPKAENGYDYGREMRPGEFIHFYSAAAGVGLKYFPQNIIPWTDDVEAEYQNAKLEFPIGQYEDFLEEQPSELKLYIFENWFGHKALVFLLHETTNLVMYADSDVPRFANWPFKLMSQSWLHVTMAYNLLLHKNESVLVLILHAKDHVTCQSEYSTDKFTTHNFSEVSTIDCGLKSGVDWSIESPGNTYYLVKEIAGILQQSSNLIKDEELYYAQPMTNMIIFDIYINTGKFRDARNWLQNAFNETEIQTAGTIFWIRDWYLSIYTTNGGVQVLNKFLYLLRDETEFLRDDLEYSKLSVGQILHLWSIASGENLIYEANKLFGWTARYQTQFEKAREQISKFTYTCYDCKISSSLSESSNILGVAITAGVFAFVLSIVLLLMYRQRIKSLKKLRELTSDEMVDFFEGNASMAGGSSSGNAQVKSTPFPKDLQIPRDQLDFYTDQVLGSGEFGIVYKGSIRKQFGNQTEITTVAVKTVKPNVEVTFFKTLLIELKVLGYLGNHQNIACLVGAVTENIRHRQLFVAIEFCAKGDLLGYLRKNRPNFEDILDTTPVQTVTTLATQANTNDIPLQVIVHNNPELEISSKWKMSAIHLLDWACQISTGMAYIGSKNVIHGDLAARNILLTADGFAKISDFGLSRQLSKNYEIYTKKSEAVLPWRWMALESLQDMSFSVQSDIWAFGVTLFEIFSLGQVPYSGLRWTQQFVNSLASGMRMDQPEFANEDVYNVMMGCMNKKPSERLSFPEITMKLKHIKESLSSKAGISTTCNYSRMEIL